MMMELPKPMTEVIDNDNDGNDFTDDSHGVQMTLTMQSIPVQRRTQEPWTTEPIDAL